MIQTVYKSEYLSKDILDEEFVKTFSVFHFVQTILGTCRVHVKNRFVTVPTVFQKLYTVLCFCISIPLVIFTLYLYSIKFLNCPMVYYLSYVTIFFHMLVFYSSVFHTRFFHNKSNVKYFLKMQQIDHRLGINRIKEFNLVLYKFNKWTVVCVTMISSLVFILSSVQGVQFVLSSLGMFWGMYSFVMETCYSCNLLLYFYLRVCFVNAIITNHFKTEKIIRPPQELNLSRKKLIRYLASRNHSFESSETDVFLREIIDGFFQYRKLYSYQIFILSLVVVTWMLVTCQYFIFVLKLSGGIEIPEAMMLIMFPLFYSFLTITFCIRIECFNKEIKRTKTLCIMVMSQYYYGRLREKAKRMLCMINENPPIFNVYDMWQLDARILLTIFNLVTPIIVALLQFAYL